MSERLLIRSFQLPRRVIEPLLAEVTRMQKGMIHESGSLLLVIPYTWRYYPTRFVQRSLLAENFVRSGNDGSEEYGSLSAPNSLGFLAHPLRN